MRKLLGLQVNNVGLWFDLYLCACYIDHFLVFIFQRLIYFSGKSHTSQSYSTHSFVILTYVCKLWTLKYNKILSLSHIRYGYIYLYILVQTIHGIIRILDTIWGSARHLWPENKYYSSLRVRLIHNGIISFHFIFLVMRKINSLIGRIPNYIH